MLLKKIYEGTNLAQTIAHIQETVSFKGLFIHITGTNDTSQTVTLANVGRVRYEKRGQTIIDADFEYLSALNHIMQGSPKDDSATAGAVDFAVYIPRRFKDDNVETVAPSDNASIIIDHPAAFDTALASATIRVYADLERGKQLYDLTMHQFTQSISSAANIPITIDRDNIIMCLLSDNVSSVITTASSNISRATIEMDGFTGINDLSTLVANTQLQLNLETDFALATMAYMADGDITARLSDSIGITVTTSGSAQPEILTVGAQFDLQRYRKTSQAQLLRFKAIQNRKVSVNKGSTVVAIQEMQRALR